MNLQEALDAVTTWEEPLSGVHFVTIVTAARRLLEGTPKAARELVDSDGNHQWVVTVLVDGPGDYILVEPLGR